MATLLEAGGDSIQTKGRVREVMGTTQGSGKQADEVRGSTRDQWVTRNNPLGVTDCGHRRRPGLRGPELGPVIQRVDQLGRQLDVIAHYLLVLCDAIDVADTTGQVSVHTGTQFTLPELWGHNQQGDQ